MARPLRIQYPGAVYHVMCRGNDRKVIFRSEDDRVMFLRLLTRSLNIYSIKLHAYALQRVKSLLLTYPGSPRRKGYG